MESASSSALRYFPSTFSTFFLISCLAAVITALTGCGSSAPQPPKLTGNTSVTVLLSSTANDQLSQFGLEIQALTLTSQSGKTVSVLSGQQPAEFIHLNGGIEPLSTVTIPQGVYTSATATIGGAEFTCVTLLGPGSVSPGSLDTSTYAYGYTPNANVTVSLPSPLTVTGASMGLSLNLQVSQSASYPSGCYPTSGEPFSITPTFTLTPATLSSQPTNPGNGKVNELEGEIASSETTASAFTLTLPEPNPENTRTVTVRYTGNTVYQRISNSSALTVGTFVDLDGTIQTDGSIQATRIAVEDSSAVDVLIGPVMQVSQSQPAVNKPAASFFSRLSQGADPIPLSWDYDISNALFQVSEQLSNLQSLPFTPVFSESNMVAGQNVYVSSPNLIISGGIDTRANTITLMPQTVNATVGGSFTSGNFTVYEASLAPYDLFPTLAVQPGQITLLTSPSQVEVYVDSNTQMLNTQALAPGSTLRFYGLVFNDNGTLRMDCAQVNDGVAFSTESNSNSHLQVGNVQIVRREGPGRLPQMITTVKH